LVAAEVVVLVLLVVLVVQAAVEAGLEVPHLRVVLAIHHQQPRHKEIMVGLILHNRELALLGGVVVLVLLAQMQHQAPLEMVVPELHHLFLVRP
jgi:hypothetical protein